MEKRIVSSTKEITSFNLNQWIREFEDKIQPQLFFLKRMYEAKDEIDKGTQKCDEGRPNNRIHSNLASMIVQNATSYFIGKPVTYVIEDKKLEKIVKENMYDSNEWQQNQILGEDMSIYGMAYELCSVKEVRGEKYPYFAPLNPLYTFQVIEADVQKTPICVVTFIKYYDIVNKNQKIKGWVYTEDTIYFFEGTTETQMFHLVPQINPFKPMLPVTLYKNNEKMLGDFENATELLNCYNRLLSNSFDDVEGVLNAVFCIYNAEISDDEAQKLNKTRVLQLLGDNTRAEFLSKHLDEKYITSLREWIRKDIFSITNIPDFTDKEFAAMQSGVALSIRLHGLENLRLKKAGYFRSGLLNRLDILQNYKNMSDKPIWLKEEDVKIQFYANLPANVQRDIEVGNLVALGVLSRKTAVENLELVTDAKEEMKRLDEDREFAAQVMARAQNEHYEALGVSKYDKNTPMESNSSEKTDKKEQKTEK